MTILDLIKLDFKKHMIKAKSIYGMSQGGFLSKNINDYFLLISKYFKVHHANYFVSVYTKNYDLIQRINIDYDHH